LHHTKCPVGHVKSVCVDSGSYDPSAQIPIKRFVVPGKISRLRFVALECVLGDFTTDFSQQKDVSTKFQVFGMEVNYLTK
jgi:hypothetical protein